MKGIIPLIQSIIKSEKKCLKAASHPCLLLSPLLYGALCDAMAVRIPAWGFYPDTLFRGIPFRLDTNLESFEYAIIALGR